MNRIYCFDEKQPPVLNEELLIKKKKRRELRRQALLLSIATFFLWLSIALFAVIIYRDSPVISCCCIAFLGFIVIGDAVIGILFMKNDRSLCR